MYTNTLNDIKRRYLDIVYGLQPNGLNLFDFFEHRPFNRLLISTDIYKDFLTLTTNHYYVATAIYQKVLYCGRQSLMFYIPELSELLPVHSKSNNPYYSEHSSYANYQLIEEEYYNSWFILKDS